MARETIGFLHDSMRAYFCAEGLLEALTQEEKRSADLKAFRYGEAVALLNDLVEHGSDRRSPEVLLRARLLHFHHLYERRTKERKEAFKAAEEALGECPERFLNTLEGRMLRAEFLRNRGRDAYEREGAFDRALSDYIEAYMLYRETGGEEYRAELFINLGKVFSDTYDVPVARRFLAHVVQIAPKESEEMAKTWGALGELAFKLRQFDTAFDHFDRNRSIMERTDGDVSRALTRMAECKIEQEDWEAANRLLDQAEHFCREEGDHNGLSFALRSRVKYFAASGRYQEAIQLLDAREIGGSLPLGLALLYGGRAYRALGHMDPSLQWLTRSSDGLAADDDYYVEAAVALLERALTEIAAGQESTGTLTEGKGLLHTFAEKYAHLRDRAAWVLQEIPEPSADEEARLLGRHNLLRGRFTSAEALFEELTTQMDRIADMPEGAKVGPLQALVRSLPLM